MKPRSIKLGLVQHACPPTASKQANLDTAVAMIRDAAGRGAQLIATQELFTGPYFPQREDPAHFALAEPIPGPTSERLADLARELGVEIAASIFEQRLPGVYHNTSILLSPEGRIVGKYRKMHIPDDPGFYEKYYFTPGDAPDPAHGPAVAQNDGRGVGWQALPTRHATAGLLVCWDQWFPEAARLTALRGAEVLLYPTAIAWHADEDDAERQRQRESWQIVQRAHAITNGVFVAAINRVGVEGELTFWGGSFVADPGGRVIAEASADRDEVLVVECDLEQIGERRRGWPFLRDRRIDAYGDLLRRLAVE